MPPLSMAYHSHDLRTRQAMVKAFNQMLSIFCARYPTLEFVSINHHLTDGNERVSRDFIDKMDPTNIQ